MLIYPDSKDLIDLCNGTAGITISDLGQRLTASSHLIVFSWTRLRRGPGKDVTAAIACCGGTILASQTWTDADARGPVLAFIRQFDARLRIVRVDSAGIGFYFCDHIRSHGYRCEGVNVASAPTDKERFANSKAKRYWMLRERFQRGEVSGLADEMLAELATITWLLDPHGRTVIEGKAEVKSALGHSPRPGGSTNDCDR